MKALHARTHVGPNGDFRLALNADDLSNVDVDVFVFVQPIGTDAAKPINGAKPEAQSGDVLREVCGKWQGDEDLIRPDQGDYEVRDPIE